MDSGFAASPRPGMTIAAEVMIAFIVRRLLQAVLVMLVVALIAFALFNFVGDPINSMVGQDTSLADRERLRQELGLNDNFVVQFARFVGHAAQGEFGMSYQQARPVGQIILEKLPATLELSLAAATLALALGVPMGIYTGLNRNSWGAQALLAVSLVGISLPTFLIGILLILVFAVLLGWLPSFGRGSVVHIGWWTTGLLTIDGWRALILPAVTLALFQMTLIMRLVRAEMIEVLRTDYIKFARARGLTNRAVNFGHALKNTLVPVITITGLQLGSIIAFAIITETVFQWPGMGLMFIQAVTFADIPVMAAYLVLVGLFFVVINLVVDLLYYVVDPRLQIGREHAAGV
jgi:peptide/nickel transport system permease protein